MKRPCWSSKTPCPLAKELEPVHPRRTYFSLTTCRRQPLPDAKRAGARSRRPPTRAIITPSLSSADSAFGSDDADGDERRRELSPSSEVDLSSPELEDDTDDETTAMPSTPAGSRASSAPGACGATPQFKGHLPRPPFPRYHGAGGPRRPGTHHSNRASPALEKDEKEFTQTASGLQRRKLSGDLFRPAPHPSASFQRYSDNDQGLFLADRPTVIVLTSPSISAAATASITRTSSPPPRLSVPNADRKDAGEDAWFNLESIAGWDRSPETIDLDELDSLLDEY